MSIEIPLYATEEESDIADLLQTHEIACDWLAEALAYAAQSGDWLYVGRQFEKHTRRMLEKSLREMQSERAA